jgi:hypothetical protein
MMAGGYVLVVTMNHMIEHEPSHGATPASHLDDLQT